MGNMVYIGKKDGVAVVHTDTQAMLDLDGVKPEITMSATEYVAAGSIARVIGGKIVVGKTDAEIAEENRQGQIAVHMQELEQIDREAGASRHVRDVSVSAGVALDAVRVIIGGITKKLELTIPEGFGEGAVTAAEIMALAPSPNATDEEKVTFAFNKALLLLNRYDPAINEGLAQITQAEMRAIPIRQKLAEIANG